MKNSFSLKTVSRVKIIFFVTGLASFIWFLVRVIPKPSRAAYPCQRAAFPLAAGFIIWLAGTFASFLSYKKAKSFFQRKKYSYAVGLFMFFATSIITLYFTLPINNILASFSKPEELPDLISNHQKLSEQSIAPEAYVSIVQSEKKNVEDITKSEIEEMVNKAIELAGGLQDIISDGDKVILKPNIVTPNFEGALLPSKCNGMVSDWRFVAAVAKAVRKLNPSGTITVMEGSAASSTLDAFDDLNYKKSTISEIDEFIAIEENSGTWLNYSSDKLEAVVLPASNALYPNSLKPNKSDEYYLNKAYYDADVLISLPVLKNHQTAGVTGAIKNLGIGCTPTNIYGNSSSQNGRWEVISHQASNLHKFIHDFYMARPADFAIMEGLQGYNNGPNDNSGSDLLEEHQENMRIILASKDPVAMDAIEALIMGDNPSKVGHLVYLNNSGVGCSDPVAIKVVGKQVGEVKKDFPHESSDAKADDYTDFTAPTASIDSVNISDKLMTIYLKTSADVKKVDVEIDGQVYSPIFTSNFENIEVDLSSITLTDALVKIHVHDQYLNTLTLTQKGTPVGFEPIVPEINFTMFPNPVLDKLNIRLAEDEPAKIYIYDMNGKLQLQTTAERHSLFNIDLSHLRAGLYLGRIEVGSATAGFKFIKAE